MSKLFPEDHCPDCGATGITPEDGEVIEGNQLVGPDSEGFIDCTACGAAWIPNYDERPCQECADGAREAKERNS